MLFSVDAHAIGRQLTGNEVYIRNLLRGFAALDQDAGFLAYVCPNCADGVPERFQKRTISEHSFLRLGVDLTRQLRRDRPDLVHVQYTAPLGCPVPVVVSIHDVSFIEHPEYFSWARSTQLRMTVRRTAQAAARVVTPSE
ncbi:MAG: glycosyltransferase, partial [Acidobacteria bacterium]|nr:glycosyltransferase [Acidobacteriota bacterium]